jgi:hypothetical protein
VSAFLRAGALSFLVGALVVTTGGSAAAYLPARVPLGSGYLGRYQWSAAVEAPETAEQRRHGEICLELSMFEPGEGSDVAGCRTLAAEEVLVESITAGRKGKLRTAIAMLFPPAAVSLSLNVSGYEWRTYQLRQLSAEELHSISPGPLSYFAHGFRGRGCVESYVAYDSSGNAVVSHPREACWRPRPARREAR